MATSSINCTDFPVFEEAGGGAYHPPKNETDAQTCKSLRVRCTMLPWDRDPFLHADAPNA